MLETNLHFQKRIVALKWKKKFGKWLKMADNTEFDKLVFDRLEHTSFFLRAVTPEN